MEHRIRLLAAKTRVALVTSVLDFSLFSMLSFRSIGPATAGAGSFSCSMHDQCSRPSDKSPILSWKLTAEFTGSRAGSISASVITAVGGTVGVVAMPKAVFPRIVIMIRTDWTRLEFSLGLKIFHEFEDLSTKIKRIVA